jgi:NAD-dependent dihydropyrimidine dehydrogenase PreA subunit
MAVQETGTRVAVIEIDRYRCIGCTVCVQSCTNDVLRMRGGKACIAYQEDCSACFSCEIDCPRDAVYLGLIGGAY